MVRGGQEYVFVDTAGIRRKGKTNLMAEKLSVVMARRHIRMAHVVLLVLDATEGVVGLDATIAGYAHEGGRALIVCVNKWDQVAGQKGAKKREFEEKIRDAFKFLDYAPIVFLSAKTGAGVRAPVRADSRGIPGGLPAHLHGRTEPLRRASAVRGTQDLLHHPALGAAARLRGVHGPRRAACISPTNVTW